MLRTEKEQVVGELKSKLARAQSLVVADYRGLTVGQATELRREFRRNGCEYKVVKNTLIKLAIGGTEFSVISPLLEGMTGLAIGYEEPATAAKISTKIAKDIEKFKIRGGYFDGKLLDTQGVKALSTMPGRDEIRAQLLATFVAPAQNILGVLTAPMRDLLLVLEARAKQLESGSQQEPEKTSG